jgi:putative radical SAM enzyme (TIGR03279 family)
MKVTQVNPYSPAHKLRIRPGDVLVSVDGQPLRDGIDLAFAESERGSALEIVDATGVPRTVRIPAALGDGLGIRFEGMRPRQCDNRCVFCFIHQLPKGMRKSLYVKDEDYRYSFLFGNFLTLTNLTAEDVDRILRQHLSPLYVSVHATDETVRRRMLGVDRSPELLPLMRRLAAGGIRFHCQIVLCPGYNEGAILERTVRDLWDLGGAVLSVGIVPVGLTRHRRGLPKLTAVGRRGAADVLRFVEDRQGAFRGERGVGFVYAADELYLSCGAAVPSRSRYDGFPQRENGVGIARLWLDGAKRSPVGPRALAGARRVTVVTGTLAAPLIEEGLAAKLRRCEGLKARVVPVGNRYLGESVGVAGLLTGEDILRALSSEDPGEVVCLPPDSVNCDGVTLDDMSLDDLAAELGCEVRRGLGGRAALPRRRESAGAA